MSNPRGIYKCRNCGKFFGFSGGQKIVVPKEELTAVVLAGKLDNTQACSVSCRHAAEGKKLIRMFGIDGKIP